ncbi:MAG: PAS domain-containing protein [Gammaproteobacteria bacterium]|nr:PAS domain-containing protein [Gammaproteobacteria bacterium]
MVIQENNAATLKLQLSSLKSVLDEVGGYVFTKDLGGCYTFANQLALNLLGLPLEKVIGKTDEHFFDLSTSNELRTNDRRVMDLGEVIEKEEINIVRSTGETRVYWTVKKPLRDAQNKITGMCGISTDITARKQIETEKERLIKNLEQALAEVKHLEGIIPICSYCHNIRDEQGAWNKLETYISQHSMANFSHGVCPPCLDRTLSNSPLNKS